jgi:hypothetical protein
MSDRGDAPKPAENEPRTVDGPGSTGIAGAKPWQIRDASDRRKSRRRAADHRETLRRLTVASAVAAVGLNAALFLQTAVGQLGPAEVDRTVLSVLNAFLPGSTLQPPAEAPSPAPGAGPVVTTGGS